MNGRLLGSLSECSTLVDLLRYRAGHQPLAQAAAFMDDEGGRVTRWSYADLDRRARAIGVLLQAHRAGGQRVLLVYPPGLDFIAAFFGCLYAGAVAVPAYPPRPRFLARFQTTVEDAAPVVALTTDDLREMITAGLRETPGFPPVPWVSTDGLSLDLAEGWQEPSLTSNHLAFLQYTSGSTSAPRGVMVTHGNLLHNSQVIQRCFGSTPEDVGMIWLPMYHDMGLIGGMLQPMFAGMPVTFMSPVAFLQRPVRWLDAISRIGATISGGPNFAYDLCVRKITPEQRATLDLSKWAVAFNGAEPVRADTLARFAAMFAPQGFRPQAWYPCYGLAEATLMVTGGQRSQLPVVMAFSVAALEAGAAVPAVSEPDARVLVGCGRACCDQEIGIIEPETLVGVPDGHVGEIWVRGASVTAGYWQRPEANAVTFGAHRVDTGDGPWLRTGDLGFIASGPEDAAGELFITGRLKELIIIDGRNHYPQDIELTVEVCHPALVTHGVAAFSVDVKGEERLVIVAELEREYLPGRPNAADPQAVTRAVRKAVSEQHAISLYDLVLVKTGSVPVTTSGKIQRRACRASYLAGSLNAIGR